MVGDPGLHCRGNAGRGVDFAEIVVHGEQGKGVLVVLGLVINTSDP